ncbi:MAG: hypothetical protein QOI56_1495, partial [Actinomycetota bacterium]|nr:hypothetical protein [Actinomycetota bacterium]
MLPSAALPLTAGKESRGPGSEATGRPGHQSSFAALVPGVRWGILALSAFVAAVREPLNPSVAVCGGVLVAHAAWRSRHPVADATVGTDASTGQALSGSSLPPLA